MCTRVSVADISSIRDMSLRVRELGNRARQYEPSLAKAAGHLERLGAEADKERWSWALTLFFFSYIVITFQGRSADVSRSRKAVFSVF